MKRCSKCKTEKHFDEFNKDKYRPDGLTSNCKECRYNAFRLYRKNNRGNKNKVILTSAVCPSCEKEKPSNSFYKDMSTKNGLQTYCKECAIKPTKEKSCAYTKKWRDENKGIIKVVKQKKVCPKCKKEKLIGEFSKDKYCIDGHTHQCKECRKENTERYKNSEHGRNKIREYGRRRYREDESYRVACNISRAIQKSLSEQGSSKNGSSIWNYLPYTPKELKEHLELQFENWMNWDNYGKASIYKRTWHIDHIIPQSKLRFDSMKHPNFLKCWSLKNLQPLCATENIRKGDKLIVDEGCSDLVQGSDNGSQFCK